MNTFVPEEQGIASTNLIKKINVAMLGDCYRVYTKSALLVQVYWHKFHIRGKPCVKIKYNVMLNKSDCGKIFFDEHFDAVKIRCTEVQALIKQICLESRVSQRNKNA